MINEDGTIEMVIGDIEDISDALILAERDRSEIVALANERIREARARIAERERVLRLMAEALRIAEVYLFNSPLENAMGAREYAIKALAAFDALGLEEAK